MKYLDEVGYDLDFRDLYRFYNDMWITLDPNVCIPLKDMGYYHIMNAIKFIEREGKTSCYGLGALWVAKLINELKKRGIEYEVQ